MPFTPSHAVVALPFVRTPLIPAAIAVGAMAPDLPLFTRNLPVPYFRTHDLVWLPVTLLLALGLLLVWRSVVRPAARELAPTWLAARLPAAWDAPASASARETLGLVASDRRRWRVSGGGAAVLALSLALGIVSHVLWDQFTHEGRAGVEAVPVLGETWGPLLGYKWLQHGSSAVGLAVVGIFLLVWLSRRDAAASVPRVLPTWMRWAWWLSLPVVLATAWVTGLAAYGPLDAEFTVAHLAYRVLPRASGLWGAATLALCVGVQVARARDARRANASGHTAAS
ncbi:DUF4184 family protein [Microbacter sp. GSS18]|nr:DUF4184 family protein [Microbacter sp. GSS18]